MSKSAHLFLSVMQTTKPSGQVEISATEDKRHNKRARGTYMTTAGSNERGGDLENDITATSM